MSKPPRDRCTWTTLAALFFASVPGVRANLTQENHGSASSRTDSPAPHARLRDARLSADGRWAVYAADLEREGKWALYAVPLEGGVPIALAGPLSAPEQSPWAISPDGERVVYVERDLFSVPIDGRSAPVRLGASSTSGEARDFVFAPDGTAVAYRAAPAGRYLGLFGVALDGNAAPRELVAPNELGDVASSYRISSLTRSVVFASRHADGVFTTLYGASLDGGPLAVLSEPGHGVDSFQLSPDGARVVYRTSPERNRPSELRSVAADGTSETLVLSGELGPGEDLQEYRIGPDGEWVVFLVDQGDGRNELFSVPIDASSASRTLARDVASSFEIHPEGGLVLYAADPRHDGRFELFAAAIEGGSEPRELAAPGEPPGRVTWFEVAPDGTRVVQRVERERGFPAPISELWRVSLGPELTSLELAEAEGAQDLRISASGERLVYRDRSARLFAVGLDGESSPVELEAGRGARAFDVSPDGAHVLAVVATERTGDELLDLGADGSAPHSLIPGGAPGGGPPGRENATSGGGFRDFSFGTSGTSTPTGEKPECKLWFNDGSWWGSLWNDAAGAYHIYRLNLANQTWADTGTVLDERSSKADVLWDAPTQKLYVASHIFTTNAQPTPDNWARLFRYSYSTASKTYALDAGFPVDITRGNAEDLTLAKDSLGRLWVTWVQASKVMVNHSIASDTQWDVPSVLPASASSVSVDPDDISAIIAFGGNKIGVIWSNQVTTTTYFAVHLDSDAATVWQPEEIVLPGANCTGGTCSDDHFSLKTDAGGRVFAALKTDLQQPDLNEVLVGVRGPSGGWATTVFCHVQDQETRPILLLDEQNSRVYVFVTTPESGGAIYFKSAPISDLRFEPGIGTPFIQSTADVTINNATSTKQNLNGQTDLVVLASDQNTRFYLHNFLDLGQGGSPPTIGSFSPPGGPVGTTVTISGDHFSGSTSVKFNGTSAGYNVVSNTRIDATVPSGATTGKISVTNPSGTGMSSASFVVTASPSITSFSPGSGPVGTRVVVRGANFGGTSRVEFNGRDASFNVVSITEIDATVPAGASSGRIRVTTSGGSATSSSDFKVTNPPIVSSFAPTLGIVATPVTIIGSHFSGTTRVEFNGTQARVFTVLSDSAILTFVPIGASSGKIRVTTSQGSGASASEFTVIGP